MFNKNNVSGSGSQSNTKSFGSGVKAPRPTVSSGGRPDNDSEQKKEEPRRARRARVHPDGRRPIGELNFEEEFEGYYYDGSKFYLPVGDFQGSFTTANLQVARSAVLKNLNDFFIPPSTSNGGTSFRQLADELVVRIVTEHNVDLVTPLSGFYPGRWPSINGKSVLVTDNGLMLNQPWHQGLPPQTMQFLHAITGYDPATKEPQAFDYLWAWLKVAREDFEACLSVKPGYALPPITQGQALFLVGPKGIGKTTVLQDAIITAILGHVWADPFKVASGASRFNGHLAGAPHLRMSDSGAPQDREKVRHFIQQMISDTRHAYEAKNQSERNLPAFHRVSVSCNKTHKDMQIIPPLDTLGGKYLLIQCHDYQKWFPSHVFLDCIAAEQEAFLYELRKSTIHPEILTDDPSGRYTIKGYADPELARMVAQLDPADRLLALIHDAYEENENDTLWDKPFSSRQLLKLIFDQDHLKPELLKLAGSSRALTELLSDLAARNDGNILLRPVHHGVLRFELGPTFKAQYEED
jgi:hypothetical protein